MKAIRLHRAPTGAIVHQGKVASAAVQGPGGFVLAIGDSVLRRGGQRAGTDLSRRRRERSSMADRLNHDAVNYRDPAMRSQGRLGGEQTGDIDGITSASFRPVITFYLGSFQGASGRGDARARARLWDDVSAIEMPLSERELSPAEAVVVLRRAARDS